MSASDDLLYCVRAEVQFARHKFPGANNNLAALVEEVGELAKALLDHSYGKGTASEVYAEAVQVIAMAVRVAMEGSTEFPYQYGHECYQNFNVNKLHITQLATGPAQILPTTDKGKPRQ